MFSNSTSGPIRGAFLVRILLAVFVFSLPGMRASAQTPSPETVVARFHEVLLSTMKDAAGLGVQGRYERLEPALAEAFHFRAMIQIATGSYWRKSTDDQKVRLSEAFSRLTVATYAAQFDGYSGQRFDAIGSKPGPQKTTLVETLLVNPEGSDVSLVYVTRLIQGKWQIIDVLLDTGISELARKRSEYSQVLRSEGVPGLLGMLDDKTASLLGK